MNNPNAYFLNEAKKQHGFNPAWAERHPEYRAVDLVNLWIRARGDAERVAVGEKITVKKVNGGPMSVTGTIKSAKPSRLRFRGRSVVVVFEVVLLCGILADVPKVEKTVHIERLPRRRS